MVESQGMSTFLWTEIKSGHGLTLQPDQLSNAKQTIHHIIYPLAVCMHNTLLTRVQILHLFDLKVLCFLLLHSTGTASLGADS